MHVEYLPWDSEFFGFKVGRVNISDYFSVSSCGYRLIYGFSSFEVNIKNGRLVDRKVTFCASVGEKRDACLSIIPAYIVTPKLYSLALQSGHYSRFKVDDTFPQGAFERMYSLWMERSINREIAKDVLMYEENGEEIGFVTLGEKNGRLDIGLLAVDELHRSKGVGAKLIDAAVNAAKEWGYSEIQVVTQLDNSRACEFYEKCGFKKVSVEYIYHIWVD
jgi:dTDP-4-amino-4,6-dideoxy-D-galactose acyltransferase